jgi:hypothetical protein
VQYALIVFLATGIAHFGAFRSRDMRNVLLVAAFTYWGLSYCNGYDWINYFTAVECEKYRNCEEAHTSFEPLFLLVAKFASATDYQVIPLLAGIAGATVVSHMQRSPRYSGYSVLYFLSIATFYLYIEQVRQGMALCLLFFASTALTAKRWRPMLITWAVACLLHWTSVLFVLPAGLALVSTRAAAVVLIGLGITSGVIAASIEEVIAGIAASSMSEWNLSKKLLFYVATEDYNTSALGLGFFIDSAFLLLVLVGGKDLGRPDPINYRLVSICYFLLLLGSRLNIAVYRLSIVFLPFVCMYIAQITSHSSSPLRLSGVRVSRKVLGALAALLCLGQAARPFTDPVLLPVIFGHQLVGITALPSDSDRRARAEERCSLLDSLDKGYLCGRW